MPGLYSSDELKSSSFLRSVIIKFIEEANVNDYDYEDESGECCEYCEDDCYDCSCHEFPGYDQYLADLIVTFINRNFIPKEESNAK